ncbi:CLUMA_CG012636, isoform A, partial [Clunio marinus]
LLILEKKISFFLPRIILKAARSCLLTKKIRKYKKQSQLSVLSSGITEYNLNNYKLAKFSINQ